MRGTFWYFHFRIILCQNEMKKAILSIILICAKIEKSFEHIFEGFGHIFGKNVKTPL